MRKIYVCLICLTFLLLTVVSASAAASKTPQQNKEHCGAGTYWYLSDGTEASIRVDVIGPYATVGIYTCKRDKDGMCTYWWSGTKLTTASVFQHDKVNSASLSEVEINAHESVTNTDGVLFVKADWTGIGPISKIYNDDKTTMTSRAAAGTATISGDVNIELSTSLDSCSIYEIR